MKVINLNSKFELTQAQISFAESIIIFGEHEKMTYYDSISVLINEIPIFLVNVETQKEINNEDFLGFYQHRTYGEYASIRQSPVRLGRYRRRWFACHK